MIVEEIIELAECLAIAHHNACGGGGDPTVGFADYEVPMAEGDFGDAFEGLLRFSDNEFQVFINTGIERYATEGRRRFTAAHEFGHYSIPTHRDGIRAGRLMHKSTAGFESREKIEREADVFAAHFLIPTIELKKRHRSSKWGAKEILDTHRHFQTSITCAALRCQAALDGNSTLILWDATSVRWQRMDRNWWFELPAKSIRTADLIARGSATERLLSNEAVPDCGFLRNGTTRAAWFRRIADWSRDNEILIEEAIPLGPRRLLTLLRPDHQA